MTVSHITRENTSEIFEKLLKQILYEEYKFKNKEIKQLLHYSEKQYSNLPTNYNLIHISKMIVLNKSSKKK